MFDSDHLSRVYQRYTKGKNVYHFAIISDMMKEEPIPIKLTTVGDYSADKAKLLTKYLFAKRDT